MAKSLVEKAFRTWKEEGAAVFYDKTKNKIKNKIKSLSGQETDLAVEIYNAWIAANECDILSVEELPYQPFFSVVIPVYNVEDQMLRECIDSVLGQTYKNFEIILVDDASTQESVRKTLGKYEGRDGITIIYRKENGNISRATNDGIKAAKGEFVALCDCDDLYAPNALYEIAKKLNEDSALDYIYTDEDKISEDGKVRRDPFFKPDWSPETFMSYMYTCHLSVFRRAVLEEVSGLRPGFEGSQDYDLVLRVMEKTPHIGHVPKILYHWRMRKESTANAMTAKPYVMNATSKAKKEALERRGQTGKLTLLPEISQYRVTYIPQGNPSVSIIIPSKDNPEVLKMCLTSILQHTDYENYEVVIVDNGSSEENKKKIEDMVQQKEQAGTMKNIVYFYEPMEFNFSRMCNIGAEKASGEFLLFLNDDIEISEAVKQNPNLTEPVEQWLTVLTGQAQVSYTGAVGCKLYYPGGIQFQHAGVLNLPIGPGHCLYGMDDDLNYYYGRNLLDYNFCAVTGACLMVERKKFGEAGGFDEELAVAYNDVALCFQLLELGYYNVLRNDVALVHHESVSRGLDQASEEKEERRKCEMKKLYEKHPKFLGGYDPCYNPNLVPDKGDFSFNMTPRV
ncbi:MAG: glycosyltransferase [Lachnospiraceae bacterium]|nr:glycosyltransferase [Lachnospiraceae bacterium]